MPSNTFNISAFLGDISKNGTLQTNRFAVDIPVNDSSVAGFLSFRAESVNIPGVQLNTAQIKRYGISQPQKMAMGISAFPDVSISFIEDSQNSIWKFFYAWLNKIYQFTGYSGKPAYNLDYKENYVLDIIIHVYDNTSKEVTTIKLKEAYPTSLGDVQMSWSQNNNLFRVNASFTYTEWEETHIAETITAPIALSQFNPTPDSYSSTFTSSSITTSQTSPTTTDVNNTPGLPSTAGLGFGL